MKMAKQNKDEDIKKEDLDKLDELMQALFLKFIKFNNKQLPLKLNLQVDKFLPDEKPTEYIENYIISPPYILVTLYTPYSLNELRFDIDDKTNVLLIASIDGVYIKEYWFGVPLIKNSIKPTYKNNILEITLLIDDDLQK